VPVFNRVKYLEQAISSILKQNFNDFEVIIIDDGSTENIKATLKKCIHKAPAKIRYIRQPNRGPAGARNRGIKEAAGKYIAFLDADDEWEEEFLSKGVEKLVSGHYHWIDTAAHRIALNEQEEVFLQTVIHAEPIDGIEGLYPLLLKENVIGSPSKVIVEKACFEKVGYFREDLRIREDWEMWMRLARAHFRFYRILEPLYQYKIRQNSLTKTESLIGLRCTYKLLCDYAPEAFKMDAANRVLYAEMMWDIARHVLSSKDKDIALFLKSIFKSQWYAPSFTRILKSLGSFKQRYA
jgi:glycosyltransferase involved in cell wall biosynthesis